jgi:hypothetical protein
LKEISNYYIKRSVRKIIDPSEYKSSLKEIKNMYFSTKNYFNCPKFLQTFPSPTLPKNTD